MDIRGFFSRWGWFLLLAAAALLGSYLLIGRKHTPNASGGSSLLPGAASQSGVNGQPVVEYVPTTGDSYTNINEQYNSGNTTSSSTTTINPLVPPAPPMPPVHHPPGPPMPAQPPTGTLPPVIRPPGPPMPAQPPTPVVHPPQPPRPTTPPPPAHPYQPYTIKWGDTLSSIASKHHTSWQILYGANKGTIDAMSAKKHHPIPGGPWNNIWPGETIQVPA